MLTFRRVPAVVQAVVFAAACTLVMLPALNAQPVPNAADVAELRTQFLDDLDTLRTKFVALANAFPADKYGWRPAPGVRSVGEVFMHVASEFYVFTPMSWGVKPSPIVKMDSADLHNFEAKSSKPDVLRQLEEGFAYCRDVLRAADPAALTGKRPLFGGQYNVIFTTISMDSDMHEHLGQLIAYARMNGIKPPWSK